MGAELERRGLGPVELIPGRSGQFDVSVDGVLAYSRRRTGRFPTDDEIKALVAAR